MEEFTVEDLTTDEKEEAIDEIMKTYGQGILQLVFSYVKDKATAEDLTQEIFIKCYKKMHTYNHTSAFRTWLWRIAINHCKDYLKSWYNRNVSVSGLDFAQQESRDKWVEETVIQKDTDKELIAAVMNLPVKHRELIYLFYYQEMQLKEIAEVTGQNINTVKSRLQRAKKQLQKMLGG